MTLHSTAYTDDYRILSPSSKDFIIIISIYLDLGKACGAMDWLLYHYNTALSLFHGLVFFFTYISKFLYFLYVEILLHLIGFSFLFGVTENSIERYT